MMRTTGLALATTVGALILSGIPRALADDAQLSLAVAEAAMEAIEQFDLDGYGQLLAPHASFYSMFPVPGRPAAFEGKEAMMARTEHLFNVFEQVNFVNETYVVSDRGDVVFLEAEGDFIVRETGATYQNRYLFVFEIEEGLVTEIRNYDNPLVVSEVFGIPINTSETSIDGE